MCNRSTLKIFGLTFGLSILASSAVADSQGDNLFLPSVSSTETITLAYRGKPPYKNRQQVRAKLNAQQDVSAKLKTQQAARAKNLDKTELSALEISEIDDKSPNTGKNTRKRHGHPYHR